MTPLVILLQGGIASGKSTVASMLADREAHVLDCDRIAHQALDDRAVQDELRRLFGDGIFTDGRVDRPSLGSRVFSDPEALRRLEALVHPWVRDRVQAALERARVRPGERRQVVVIDAAVAEKMRLTERYDLRVFVAAGAEARRARAAARGWEPGELERREAQQGSLAEKQSTADYVVANDGDLSEAESHVERFWSELVEPRR